MKSLALAILLLAASVPVTSLGTGATEWAAGRDYIEIVPQVDNGIRPNEVLVVELFSYSCGACNAFETPLHEWLAHKPAYINFVRFPVTWTPYQLVHARLYYTLEALGRSDLHRQVFDAIHKRREKLWSPNADENLEVLKKFAASNGLSADEFAKVYNSQAITQKVESAGSRARAYLTDRTPTVVVNGRYTTNPVRVGWEGNQPPPFGRMLSLVDFLVAKERPVAVSSTHASEGARK